MEGAEEVISRAPALAEDRSQPVSGAREREEHILMQRRCSGSGRTHQRPRPPPPPGLPPPRQDSSRSRGSGEERWAAQGGGDRAGAASSPGAASTCSRQHPSFTPGKCQPILSPPAAQGLPGALLWAGTQSSVSLQLGRGTGRTGAPAAIWGQSDFSPLGLGVPSALSTWVASCRAQQAKPGQEAGPQQCVQKFKPATG